MRTNAQMINAKFLELEVNDIELIHIVHKGLLDSSGDLTAEESVEHTTS